MPTSQEEATRALARRGPEGSKELVVRRWGRRLGAGRSMGLGALLAGAGTTLAVLSPPGVVLGVATSALLTVGGGLLFLGLEQVLRRRKGGDAQGPQPTASRAVLDERSRRIRRLMAEGGGEWTFELLQARLGWTEEAVASALKYLRDRGEVVEDLNLETGRWTYRFGVGEKGALSSANMTLDDRLERLASEE